LDFRSATAGGSDRADALATLWPTLLAATPVKFYWFLKHGYRPHIWQALFHASENPDHRLFRFRHLVAGRRGGKTLSAAWETLFYATHPQEYHRDFHGEESDRPLWMWALAKDYKVGRPALLTFLEVIRKVGLVKDKDYRWNKTEKVFEFYDEEGNLLSTVEFKSADDPQNLRGAGLDWLWIDEAAFLPNEDAWNVTYPGLTDKAGAVVTTTTPHGKNWFYEEFFTGDILNDPDTFRVEYTSIDNPHFRKSEWERALKRYHPVMFKQEFMAAFDAMAGIALQGDWLKYYVYGNPDVQTGDISLKPYRTEDGNFYNLRLFMGVDPAISLSEKADHFAMALVGLTHDSSQAFLLDYFEDRIEFPDQLDMIREWFLKYRPELIGIESVAYQRALAQMAMRMQGLPNIVPVIPPRGVKKEDRILGLGPFAKVGRLRIHRRHSEFIDRWVSYNPDVKNPNDDLLDATEIALGVAGVLLPRNLAVGALEDRQPGSLQEEADLALAQALSRENRDFHPDLGIEA
jgi:hypothetical protein